MTITVEQDTIYLQPRELVEWDGEGRQWCEDDVWEDEGHSGIRYVRADKAEEQIKLLREAWAKRTGTVEVTGEAVPYLKIHFDSKEDMATFDDVLRQALEATNG